MALNGKTYTQDQTDYIDAWMRQFITLHKLGRIDPIPYVIIRETMPHTKLKIDENRLLDYITDWTWGNGYREVLESSFSLISWATDKITGGSEEL